MAGDDVQEIKSKLDIVEVIADYVSLKRNGKTGGTLSLSQ